MVPVGSYKHNRQCVRPALQIIKTARGYQVSSCFIMEVLYREYGYDGILY